MGSAGKSTVFLLFLSGGCGGVQHEGLVAVQYTSHTACEFNLLKVLSFGFLVFLFGRIVAIFLLLGNTLRTALAFALA